MVTPSGQCNSSPLRQFGGETWTLFLADGTRVAGTGLPGDAQAIADRNGNTITVYASMACSSGSCAQGASFDGINFSVTDQLNRTFSKVTTFPNGNPVDVLSAPGYPAGQALQWTVNWQLFTSTDGGYSNGTGQSVTPGVVAVSAVTMPSVSGENLKYQFSYWISPGWGEMQTATTPYGVQTSYSYICEGVTTGCSAPYNLHYRPAASPNVPLGQKIQQWLDSQGVQRSQNWAYSGITGRPGATTTVTAPDGGVTTHLLCGPNDPGYGKECTTTMPNQDTVTRTWTATCDWGAGPEQTLASELNTVGGQQSTNSYTYDRNGNMLTSTEAGGARQTVNTFTISTGVPGALGSAPFVCGHSPSTVTQDPNAFWSASDAGGTLPGPTLNARASQTISDPAGDPPSSWTYTFDNPYTTANVKTETNASVGVAISHTYDGNGNLATTTDGNSVVTQYNANFCSDGNGHSAYPSAIVQDPTGLNMTTGQKWDCMTGLMASTTDPNSVLTSYSYDSIGRKTQTVEAGMRTTAITYAETSSGTNTGSTLGSFSTTPLVVTTTRSLDSGRNIIETQSFDELGKPALRQSPDTSTYGINVQTFSRVAVSQDGLSYEAVSNSYRQTSEGTMGWTRTKYDTNGRVAGVDHFDGSTPPCPFNGGSPSTCNGAAGPVSSMTTAWSGYAATITDEAGVQKKDTYDPLGRLAVVQENPSGSGPMTSYGYDFGNRLRSVTQGSQTRTFGYDGIGRLKQAVNPESGTISYSNYDGNGNLLTKQTATGTSTMGYDHLNRVITKSYTGSVTPAAQYCYDGNTSASGCASAPTGPYSNGRLTMVRNANSTSSILSYDALGRVLSGAQTTGGATYNLAYTYNLLDGITSQTYPSGRVVTTTYDNAGRLGGVQNYASSVSYAPNNAVNSLTLGNGITETTTFNTRLQPVTIQAGSLLTLSYSYGSSNNNGNVQTASIARPGLSFSQYFVYDPMNRLLGAEENPQSPPSSSYVSSFTCPSGVSWCEQYGYDVYGNRSVPGSLGVGVSPYTPTSFDAATNQNRGGAGSGWLSTSYDPSGNITTDPAGNAFTYDVESRQLSGGGASYKYDSDGKRVLRTTPDGNQTTYVYDAAGSLAAEYPTSPSAVTGTQYLTVDTLGSTRLVTSATNTLVNGSSPGGAGTAIECRDYLPFGEVLTAGRNNVCASGDVGVTALFTGKERDAETGLDYFGARYMSSAQGRFTSPDPLDANLIRILNPQRWNKYAYAINDPFSFTDPTGTDAVAVNFSGMVGGLGHEGVLSIHSDGSATYARFGPATQSFRGGYGLNEPGRVDTVGPTNLPKVQFGPDGLPTAASYSALKQALAKAEAVSPNTVRLNYFKTSAAETLALDTWIQQQKAAPGQYRLCSRNCAAFSVSGLTAGGAITSKQATDLSINPNLLFQQLGDLANQNQPAINKEKVTSTISFPDTDSVQTCQ